MAHIELQEFENMTPEIQEKARPILEKTGELGDIFKLMALDENIYMATDRMVQGLLDSNPSLLSIVPLRSL